MRSAERQLEEPERCNFGNGVDLMGRLSNPPDDFAKVSDKGVRDLECRVQVSTGAYHSTEYGHRQVQNRLGPHDIEKLITAYTNGNSVGRLVDCFKVNRTTVLAHLDRNGVPRRPTGPKLSDKHAAEAGDLCRDGLSLAAIGHRFGVTASTVGKALRRANVQIRPRRGWVSD